MLSNPFVSGMQGSPSYGFLSSSESSESTVTALITDYADRYDSLTYHSNMYVWSHTSWICLNWFEFNITDMMNMPFLSEKINTTRMYYTPYNINVPIYNGAILQSTSFRTSTAVMHRTTNKYDVTTRSHTLQSIDASNEVPISISYDDESDDLSITFGKAGGGYVFYSDTAPLYFHGSW